MTVESDSYRLRIERVARKAGDYLEQCGNCAQATLRALMEEFALGDPLAVTAATTWLPGLVARKETCGASLGGLMALGFALGKDRETPDDSRYWEDKRCSWRFCEEFKRELGSTQCGDIRPRVMGRDYDTMNPEELEQFLADGGLEKCRLPVETAARIVAGIILEARAGEAEPGRVA